jgi:hypothetical protein
MQCRLFESISVTWGDNQQPHKSLCLSVEGSFCEAEEGLAVQACIHKVFTGMRG